MTAHDPICVENTSTDGCTCQIVPDAWCIHDFCVCELIAKVRRDTLNAAAAKVNKHAMDVYTGTVKFEESADWLDSWDNAVRNFSPPKAQSEE